MLSAAFSRIIVQKANLLDPPHQKGRPRVLENESALQYMFQVCRTGMQWREVHSTVSYTTIFRTMHRWAKCGVFEEAYKKVLEVYKHIQPPTRYCIDSTFVKNAYGRTCVGRNPTDRGRKASKLSVITDQHGVVHGMGFAPANKPDVILMECTLKGMLTSLEKLPLYADRGYDSRHNRQVCMSFGLKDRI